MYYIILFIQTHTRTQREKCQKHIPLCGSPLLLPWNGTRVRQNHCRCLKMNFLTFLSVGHAPRYILSIYIYTVRTYYIFTEFFFPMSHRARTHMLQKSVLYCI